MDDRQVDQAEANRKVPPFGRSYVVRRTETRLRFVESPELEQHDPTKRHHPENVAGCTDSDEMPLGFVAFAQRFFKPTCGMQQICSLSCEAATVDALRIRFQSLQQTKRHIDRTTLGENGRRSQADIEANRS